MLLRSWLSNQRGEVMEAVFTSWNSEFVVSLLRDGVLPVLAGGVIIAAIFWLVGYLVDHLFRLMR